MARVSTTTVSHVINGTRAVSEEARERVLASIQALGYSPDAMARTLKTGRRNLIGFVVPDIANEFFAIIIEEIEKAISKENYKLIIANTKDSIEREADAIRSLVSGVVDGLIIASTMKDYNDLKPLIPDGFPVVFVDRSFSGCHCDSITISQYESIYQAVDYLIMEGHSHIAYIAGQPWLSITKERQAGLRDALLNHGLTWHEEDTSFCRGMSREARQILDKTLKGEYTALIVPNTTTVSGVLSYLSDHGLSVGEKVDIVGYQDTAIDEYILRGLSCVKQPVKEMGYKAGERILERIQNTDEPVKQMVLQSSFVPKSQKK